MPGNENINDKMTQINEGKKGEARVERISAKQIQIEKDKKDRYS